MRGTFVIGLVLFRAVIRTVVSVIFAMSRMLFIKVFCFFKIVTLARNDGEAKRREQERSEFHVGDKYLSDSELTTLENGKKSHKRFAVNEKP
jgi:hypothetical protein